MFLYGLWRINPYPGNLFSPRDTMIYKGTHLYACIKIQLKIVIYIIKKKQRKEIFTSKFVLESKVLNLFINLENQ